MNKIYTPLIRVSFLFLVFFLSSFYQGSFEFYRIPNLINVTDVEINRDNPAFFNFSFERNDVINVNIQKVFGVKNKANIEDLSIKVRNLGRGETNRIPLGRDFKIKERGEYSLEIQSSKKKDIVVSILIEVSPGKKYEAGKSYEILKVRNLYIGNNTVSQNARNQPRFRFNFRKNDKVTITSSSNAAAALKVGIVELGDLHTIGSPITIEEDGDYTFRFFVEQEANQPWLDKLFGPDKDGIAFNDLVIRRQVYKEPVSPSANSGGGFNNSDPLAETEDAIEEGVDPVAEALKSMEEFLASQAEEKVDSALQAGGELIEFSSIIVHPKMNLDKSPNRICRKLEDLTYAPVPPVMWAYWIGATKKSDDIYQSLNDRFKTRYGLDLMEFYTQKMLKKQHWNYKKPNAFVPMTSAAEIKETIEYAIVDLQNKLNFEAGLPYRAMANGNFIFGNKAIKTDYGNGFIPAQETYLCLCNHNRLSPIEVNFKFQNFAYLETF